jgi:hypothetical protein
MKKVIVLSGIGVMALVLLSFAGKNVCENSKRHHKAKTAMIELQQPFLHSINTVEEIKITSYDEIVFIETEEKIDLGFDTKTYLPKGFNAYKGMDLELNQIDFVEVEEEIDLGFDTAEYLPADFNAYKGMDDDKFL